MFLGASRRASTVCSERGYRMAISTFLRHFRSRSGGSSRFNGQKTTGNGGFHSSSSWKRPIRNVLFAATAAFSFKEYGIPDEHIKPADPDSDFDYSHLKKDGWEILYEEGELKVFRRRRHGHKFETFEYRCQGKYTDISPRQFLDVQNDVDYRKEWDNNIHKLELLEDDGEEEQLIRWVARYPYPMYAREYVFVRRTIVSEDGKNIIVECRALPQEVVGLSGNFVRVNAYESRMCVRCHTDMETRGLDYVLTYFDNPEANIPTYAYNWIVNQAGPIFVKSVHTEALKLAKSGREIGPTVRMPRKEKKMKKKERPMECPMKMKESKEDEKKKADKKEEGIVVEDKSRPLNLPGKKLIIAEDVEESPRKMRTDVYVDEEETVMDQKPRPSLILPGKKLIPKENEEEAPAKKGRVIVEVVEERKEVEKKDEEYFLKEEDIPISPIPGKRIFTSH